MVFDVFVGDFGGESDMDRSHMVATLTPFPIAATHPPAEAHSGVAAPATHPAPGSVAAPGEPFRSGLPDTVSSGNVAAGLSKASPTALPWVVESSRTQMALAKSSPEDGPTVQANNFAFDPTEASVESGEDLYLKNGNANTPHTFTVEGTDIDVELAPLANDEVKVDLDPGTYEFHCRFHAQMTGTLTVT